MTRGTLWDRPGPAAPIRPSSSDRVLAHPDFARVQGLDTTWTLRAPHRLPGLSGSAGPVGPWTRSGVGL